MAYQPNFGKGKGAHKPARNHSQTVGVDQAPSIAGFNPRVSTFLSKHRATNSGNTSVASLADDISNGKKGRRSSAIKMDAFNLSQDQQLAAIQKEVEWLKKEVPHFDGIYTESRAIFSHQKGAKKRTKAETESFALIQSLAAWVHEHGCVAVKEYADFKKEAIEEMSNLVGKYEQLEQQNKKLNLIREQEEHDKEDALEKLAKVEEELKKLQSSEQDMAERNRAMQLNQNELGELRKQVEEFKSKNKSLNEKYERVQKYWQMAQTENDDLRKKTSGFESEIRNLRDQNVKIKQEMQSMKTDHHKQVQQMEAEHRNYAEQMKLEQEKFMESARAAAGDGDRMGGGGAARNVAYGDHDDDHHSGAGDDYHSDSDHSDHFGKVMSLGDDMQNVYEYEDDDWLDDETESFSSEDMDVDPEPEPEPEPVKEPTPPPKEPTPEPVNQQEFFETEKTSMYQDLVFVDRSLTFKEERLSAGQEERRQKGDFESASKMESVQAKPVVVEAPKKEESPEPKELLFEKGRHLTFSVEETRVVKKAEDYSSMKAGLRSRPHLFPVRVDVFEQNAGSVDKLKRDIAEMQTAARKEKESLHDMQQEAEKEFKRANDLQHELAQEKERNEKLQKEQERLQKLVAAASEEATKAKAAAQFAAQKAKEEPEPEEEEPKEMAFESVKTGTMSQSNMMVHRGKIKNETKIIRATHVVHKSKEHKDIQGGTNFHERLKMFQHKADTVGGKPQPLPLSQQRAFGLITKLATKRNLLQGAGDKKVGVDAQKDDKKEDKEVQGVEGQVAKLLDDIQSNKANVHIERSTTKNTLKITKCTAHLLKPRLYGYMNIKRSSFIPRWKMSQNPRYFFVLDGLPSETNINQTEPDFAKNRKHDHLVPTLCFFENKEKYDEFHALVKEVPTRTVEFQKKFAQYAKGTYPLSSFAIDVSIDRCTRRINVLLNKTNLKLPKGEVADVGQLTDLDIICCSDSEIHKFSCNDKVTRDKWVKKVNKLVDKRSKRLAEINSGLFGVATGYNPKRHKHDAYDKEIETDVESTRATMVANGTKLIDVDKVEDGFD